MKQILYKLFEHQYLGRDEARTILQNIAQGKYNDVQVASLITVFLMRNISVEELCGFRDALLEMRVPVDLSEFAPIDIVGTGGDGKNTFNISTAACVTVAGTNQLFGSQRRNDSRHQSTGTGSGQKTQTSLS